MFLSVFSLSSTAVKLTYNTCEAYDKGFAPIYIMALTGTFLFSLVQLTSVDSNLVSIVGKLKQTTQQLFQ